MDNPETAREEHRREQIAWYHEPGGPERMNRRELMRSMGLAGGIVALTPWSLLAWLDERDVSIPESAARKALEALEPEAPAQAEVRVERGGPRLFVNGKEVYPLMALSAAMYPTIDNYRQGGIHYYNPILGMRSAWKGPGEYDWSWLDLHFGRMLTLDPDAYFFPRLHLNTPDWWKETHPDQLIEYGYETNSENHGILHHLERTDGGYYYGLGRELREASFASEQWRRDTGEMIRAFIRHVEETPLAGRIIGYHITTGHTGEWNYFGAQHLPDYSKPMQQACGGIPSTDQRTSTAAGLLRDPEKENEVIRFYLDFHDTITDTILYLAGELKDAVQDRVLCGVFYGYLLEQVRIQDGGYLGCRKILESPDIDVIISPYTYQGENFDGNDDQPSGMVDGAGNWLGRARGVGGDGGFRVPMTSVERHGKLFLSEMDPSTYLSKKYRGIGGPGSETVRGSVQIFQRDLGQVFTTGVGGWLYDFGPLHQTEQGWYSGEPLINEMRSFSELGEQRPEIDISSVAEIAAVYDDRTFAATQHWTTEKPWKNYGISVSDFFNHWFLNSQARALHRIGAPMDVYYLFDFLNGDLPPYKLIFMVNPFYLSAQETKRLQQICTDSGATVVWYYAPGYITPDNLDLQQMESLTGFRHTRIDQPGPMMIRNRTDITDFPDGSRFGVGEENSPRFAVQEESPVEVLGTWDDSELPAFARRKFAGWSSVYTGTAPLPVQVLRWIASQAGVHLWSTRPDNVRAVKDAAMIVASGSGERTLRLPAPLRQVGGKTKSRQHSLDMEFGEVRLFLT